MTSNSRSHLLRSPPVFLMVSKGQLLINLLDLVDIKGYSAFAINKNLLQNAAGTITYFLYSFSSFYVPHSFKINRVSPITNLISFFLWLKNDPFKQLKPNTTVPIQLENMKEKCMREYTSLSASGATA